MKIGDIVRDRDGEYFVVTEYISAGEAPDGKRSIKLTALKDVPAISAAQAEALIADSGSQAWSGAVVIPTPDAANEVSELEAAG